MKLVKNNSVGNRIQVSWKGTKSVCTPFALSLTVNLENACRCTESGVLPKINLKKKKTTDVPLLRSRKFPIQVPLKFPSVAT